jgi:diamine N-acetyltransferase
MSLKRTIVNVILKPADRSNWRTMVGLQLKPEQQAFVSPPAWSFARCYVRFFGDEFEHLPHVIYADGQAVGYSTTACNPASDEDYWIDDIMIDAAHQGRGYGRAAVIETVRAIVRRYSRCRAVQLTCFRANTVAATLYLSLGFLATGQLDGEFGEPNYKLAGSALDKYR